ncbi:hypothetical protein V1264_001504 [Littorina saxatilis]
MNNTTDMTPILQDAISRHMGIGGFLEAFAPASIQAERIVPPVWWVIGFLGNPVCAVIWYGRRMRRNNSSAVYLGSLAVSDFLFLILHLMYNLHTVWGHDIYNAHGACEAFMFFFYLPQYMSVSLVAAFTVERYVAVCHPFLKEKWCTVRRAFIVVLILLIFCAALSSGQIYLWSYHPGPDHCSYRLGTKEFVDVWNWTVDMIMFAAVPLLVLLFNVLVLREIIKLSSNGVITRQQGRSSGNTASTLTLLSVSFFLVVTQLAATVVLNIQVAIPVGDLMLSDDEIRADGVWSSFFTYMDVRKIVEVVCLSHFACYFFVYALTGKHFRREVLYLLTCHGKLHCLDFLFKKAHKGERYSMVSSNGHTLATDTCTTAYTTSM